MPVATYYFDGSDAAATDPDAAWTNETNADDGSTATVASYTSGGAGSASSNFIKIEGTNAPASGGSISQVRVRAYGTINALVNMSTSVYTDSLAELLGTNNASNITNAYSSYTTLSAPTGGWTWAKVQALETKIYLDDGTFSGEVAVAEIEVTTAVDQGSANISWLRA